MERQGGCVPLSELTQTTTTTSYKLQHNLLLDNIVDPVPNY
jgi:hypothetical protein